MPQGDIDKVPYYENYDQHYKRLYEQGIGYWSDSPDHCKRNIQQVTSRIIAVRPSPQGLSLLDIGCGEGHLAIPISDRGLTYVGVDCSPHAIAKGKGRVREGDASIEFKVMDALSPDSEFLKSRFDIVLDQACLHMFVVDHDRRVYLSNIKELMAEGGVFILSGQEHDEEAYDGEIRSIDEYERIFQHDLSKPKRWEAWNGAEWVTVELPGFACRRKRKESYVKEFEAAGFLIENVYENPDGHTLDFVLIGKAGA